MSKCERCGKTIAATLSQRLYCGDCKRAVSSEVHLFSKMALLRDDDHAKLPRP